MLQIVGREGGGREGKIVIPMSEALRAADKNWHFLLCFSFAPGYRQRPQTAKCVPRQVLTNL
jgi:hypothetical protein